MHIALVSTPVPKLPFHPIERKYSEIFFQKYVATYLNHLSTDAIKNLWQVEKVNQGLLYIASSLKQNNFEVSYYAFGSNPYLPSTDGFSVILKELLVDLKKFDLVCIYSITCNYHLAEQIAKTIKTHKPEIIIGLGGPHATAAPEQIIGTSVFDFVGLGEGERTVVEIAKYLDTDGKLNPVAGTFVKTNGKLIIGASRKRENPVGFQIPAYEVAKIDQLPAARIFPNRGCPNSCVFCADPWKKEVAYVNFEKIAEEVNLLYSNYGTRFLYLGCEDFLFNETRALEIAKIINNTHSDIKWVAQCRVKPTIDNNTLKLLSRYGCIGLEFGVESADQEILNQVRKNITVEDAKKCFKLAKSYGFYTHAYWMIGLPGETSATAHKTIATMLNWVEEDIVDTWEYKMFFPYPGTPVYMHPDAYGIKIHTHDYRLYHYALDPVISSNGLGPAKLRDIYLKGLNMSADLIKIETKLEKTDIGVDFETIENMF